MLSRKRNLKGFYGDVRKFLVDVNKRLKNSIMEKSLFSPEEVTVLYECEIESIYKRALPLSLLCGALCYIGVKKEYLYNDQVLGSFPMVMLGALVGFKIGKVTYAPECRRRFYALPESQHGAFFRAFANLKEGEALIIVTPTGDISTVTL